ncbi:dephospho-CoA kinase [Corallincola platygyrae]|uniref:Dephospho-CoA kinase n=1 Tax=Corallincola platygyrae TaxID=1193278 RepID=A0ABW4XQF0_9GAMM
MFVVGLTGGIGSGKSTVAAMFSDLGITVVDADQVAREVVAKGSEALSQIASHFGQDILLPTGELDRTALRSRVFADQQERHWLNTLLHPLIGEEMRRQLSHSSSPYTIWMVPLLVENKLTAQADRVLVIDVPESIQIQRATSRDSQSQQQITDIMNSQASRAERLSLADDTLDNNRPESEVRQTVESLHHHYLRLAAQKETQAN